MDQISCCCFDLETTNLSADFGVILCGVVLGSGSKPKVFRGDSYPNWGKHRSDDSNVLKAIVGELSNYDIWCAHNGQRFDVPFLRTRLLHHKLPPLPNKKLVDPVLLARNKLRMNFNGLGQVANLLGCNSKTDVEPIQWIRAALDGSKKAMNYIVEHCIEDVKVLEKVLAALKNYSTTLNNYGSGF